MYGLPQDLDVSAFVGEILEVLVVGQYQLTLRFSQDCTINIEGLIAMDSEESLALPESLTAIFPLINRTVESASTTEDGTLTLGFSNGKRLRIIDSNTNYESYNFKLRAQDLVVV